MRLNVLLVTSGVDPNLFHLDWERTFEVLAAIVVLSMVLERALSVVFENRAILQRVEGRGIKEFLALAAGVGLCLYLDFDALSIIVLQPHTGWAGRIVTGAVIAGGAKASVKLFRDALGFRSTAYSEYEQLRQQGKSTKDAAEIVGKGEAPPPKDAGGAPKPGVA